jgi:hypothetical protein
LTLFFDGYTLARVKTKTLPVRLPPEVIARIDAVAKSSGINNRTAIIKFCVSTFLDHIEAEGKSAFPPNWKEIIKRLDGRTFRYIKNSGPVLMVAEQAASYGGQIHNHVAKKK